MRTDLARVRGLGSAKDGTTHFWHQRLTAIANVVLISAFVVIVISVVGKPHAQAAAVMANPLVAIIMLLVVGAGVYHMKLGMQVIIEDYVHSERRKFAALLGNIFFSIIVGAACGFAVLKLGFGG
jgi:succinate dehydrogenase / fumarate reductase membrane anchor subunit